MKPNELMIGDWVQVPSLIDNMEHYDALFKVRQLRDCDLDVIGFKELKYNEIAPIPITAEILKKNGFVKQDYDGWLISENNGRRLIEYRTDYFDGLLIINYVEEPYSKISIKLKYVHELQHALRLCGNEKEIKI